MAMPVSMVWLKDPTRHLLKENAVDAHADSDDAAPPAQTDQKSGSRDNDSPDVE